MIGLYEGNPIYSNISSYDILQMYLNSLCYGLGRY